MDPIQDGTNWYVYCSNNPLNRVDPTGLKQNWAQKALTTVIGFAAQRSDTIKNFVQDHTCIDIVRDVYKGKDTKNSAGVPNGTCFKDKMSVKLGPIPLNSVQVQSTPDWNGVRSNGTVAGTAEELPTGMHSGELGVDGATSPYIKDAIQINGGSHFIHDNWKDGSKPYSLGCPMTADINGDLKEVKDILRNDIGMENGDNVKIKISDNKGENNRDNL